MTFPKMGRSKKKTDLENQRVKTNGVTLGMSLRSDLNERKKQWM